MTACGLCGIAQPFAVADGYQAPIVADPTPSNREWRQLGPTRQKLLTRLTADGLTPRHHQCCVIALLDGADVCHACAVARAAHNRQKAWEVL